MKTLKIASAQFEPKDGDKAYNLSVMDKLCAEAKEKEADIVSFHEMCISAYTFTKELSEREMLALAEEVPNGPSSLALIELSRK